MRNRSLNISNSLFLIATMTLPAVSLAAPNVTLEVKAEREVMITDANGQSSTVIQPVAEAAPGDTLMYTLTYRNDGDEAATNIKLDNPVPEGTRYVADSAWGDGATIQFSIDAGQTFKAPASLTYQGSDGQRRAASAEQYTTIRWLISEIQPGAAGKAGFSVVVE